ncbi:hypothetical protein SAMN05444387_2839 [Flavobacterium pectinovorum]|uniref:Uncharacterized protein n=1 Tax=Flavobacterium pectinovorum TaxID=29533 RepID=A0ABY1J573_9FLAO|nr:hypothetical protein SAMN05444387_2839 [Flavobacterium pectinovorum]
MSAKIRDLISNIARGFNLGKRIVKSRYVPMVETIGYVCNDKLNPTGFKLEIKDNVCHFDPEASREIKLACQQRLEI